MSPTSALVSTAVPIVPHVSHGPQRKEESKQNSAEATAAAGDVQSEEGPPPSVAPKPEGDPDVQGGDGEEEGEIINGVVQWTWEPFLYIESRNMWAVNPIGVQWLKERVEEIDNIEGPQGVSLLAYEKRIKEKRFEFKENLAEEFMCHFKNFDVNSVLPSQASKSKLKSAEKRILKKIDNILQDRNKKSASDAPDLLDLLFRQIRRTAPRDCWAKGDSTYKQKEMERMIKNKWTSDMDRQTVFPIQMQSRRELWEELPAEEKQKWEVEAAKQKDIVPGRAELLAAMTEVFASMGDAWVARTGWYMEVRTMGIGEDGLPHFYAEKFQPVIAGKIADYSKLPTSQAYDLSMRKAVADLANAKLEDVKEVLPWKPKVFVPKPRGIPLVKFTGTIKVDDTGNIESSEDVLREAIINYMNMTYALCPASRNGKKGRPKKPNWNHMWRSGMDNYMDPKVLPPSPFIFDNPERLKEAELKTLAEWLLKGERGELDPAHCFRWKGQQVGAAIGVHRVGATSTDQPQEVDSLNMAETDSHTNTGKKQDGETKTQTAVEGKEEGRCSPKRPLEECEPKPKKKCKVDSVPSDAVSALGDSGQSSSSKPSKASRIDVRKSASPDDKTVNSGRQKRRRLKKEDSDTEEDDTSEALVVKGRPARTFNGDMAKWLQDFGRRCDHLDWEESLVEGPMGSPVPLSTRFIDGMEVRSPEVLPESSVPQAVARIIEEILMVSKPLPQPSILQMQGGKHGQRVFDILLKRVEEVLLAVVTYAANGESPILRVGGNMGLFPGLRALEFLRRYVHTVDKDPSKHAVIVLLLARYDCTLAKEAWRRWAILSFEQSKHGNAGLLYEAWLVWMETVMRMDTTEDEWYRLHRSNTTPKIVDDIAQIATKRVRPIQTDDFGVPYADQAWATAEIREEVKAWIKEMGNFDIKNTSVVDVFLWTYCLYMVSGPGGESDSEWCTNAIQMSIRALLEESKVCEADILDKRNKLIGVELDSGAQGIVKAKGRSRERPAKKQETKVLFNEYLALYA
ncbi:hypothetical protein M422DRAFT_49357 [Sphaerobolus stellatus SS14]|uniref:Unplaced genomic scaffold SPHSTscaffold_72, whole genome shotgun sequence n=1 Tax=Sphaerobolus stellatus (strain SS14) TaxID=990650 RepID=A0A0C9UYU0_SPHS4|nr:hypothetical protein M422DRAFT_49357 [Sphaerobolus stellatus SS14]